MNIMARVPDLPDQDEFEHYGLSGFPTVMILDNDGSVLHGEKPNYWRPATEASLNAGLAAVEELFKYRRAALAPDATAAQKAELQLVEGMRHPASADFAALEKAAAVAGVDAALKKRFESFKVSGPFAQLFEGYRKDYNAESDAKKKSKLREQAMAKTYALLKSGSLIEDPTSRLHYPFWVLAFDGAIQAGDAKLAKRALTVFESAYPQRQPIIESWRERLAKLGG